MSAHSACRGLQRGGGRRAGEAHGSGGLEAAAQPRRDAAWRGCARRAAQHRQPRGRVRHVPRAGHDRGRALHVRSPRGRRGFRQDLRCAAKAIGCRMGGRALECTCRFHGAAGAFETERYLVIVNPGDQTQHTISFALVSNTDLRREEFDAFHTARASHGIAQVTKREVCPLPATMHRQALPSVTKFDAAAWMC